MNYDRLAECPQFTVVNEYVPELEVGSGVTLRSESNAGVYHLPVEGMKGTLICYNA